MNMADSMEPPATTSPAPAAVAIKRIRQACTTCRQKKVKCSGDRPRCVNCRRAMQRCQYEPYSVASASVSRNSAAALLGLTNDPDLLQRISMIEDKLAQLDERNSTDPRQVNALEDANMHWEDEPALPSNQGEDLSAVLNLDNGDSPDSSEAWRSSTSQKNLINFNTIPPDPVTQSLVDTFFKCVHNQPYSYFHEESFRRKLAAGQLARCVVLAVLASSLRFSGHTYYQGATSEAIQAYAREAWLSVLNDHMAVEDTPGLEVAQATNILAIIDFTSGRTSSGWLKIGLAVRVAQDLQLMKEPSESLPTVEQEERRRCFWSIYLLDKLVSLGRDRHLAILDESCHVQLPCDEPTFRSGCYGRGEPVTLHQLLDWKTDNSVVQDGFRLAMMAGAILGRCTRTLFQDLGDEATPLWDSRSEFASIVSLLLLFESRLQLDGHPIEQVVAANRVGTGDVDHQVAGHVVFARTVYHSCFCLLYHPFLLHKQLQRLDCRPPPSFLKLASRTSYDHARSLVGLLHDAEAAGCHLGASFYAYSACLAGSTLSLHMHAEERTGGERSAEMLEATQESITMLDKMGRFWDHASKMHHQLVSFNANAHLLTSLLEPPPQAASSIGPEWEAVLWSMVDYGAMCRESTLAIPGPTLPVTSEPPLFSAFNLDKDGGLEASPGANRMPEIDEALMNFDTPSITYLLELASGGG
ncbi:hypothetical protein QIS74_07922 [Colletotrichum tabaci]|uniref:Zn(2)-C6 fungal-type domain-containing protein n=1 Tax=Colletotrichum tabaci TaxID=1209068 RepID=A0AAV9T6M3_9PEZI